MTSVPSTTTLLPDEDMDYTVGDYDYGNFTDTYVIKNTTTPTTCAAGCVTLVVINVIIYLLGIVGNGVVIWVIAYKMKKKTVNTTWYLSLALSDFIFCATVPFNITLWATGSWPFGLFMCKFTSFVLFLNMFSSIFLMVIISVDRCVTVVCAVWAQNHRTQRKAAIVVVAAWLFSMLLSIPSLVVRDVTDNQCHNNFELLGPPGSEPEYLLTVFRFVLGFVFPLIIITVCYTVIIVRIQKKFAMFASTKPLKVMTALIVTFVIFWLPYHVLTLLDIPGQIVAALIATVVSVSSCMNPFLYAFMGRDVKQNLLSSFVSKIQNTFMEERSSGTVTSQA